MPDDESGDEAIDANQTDPPPDARIPHQRSGSIPTDTVLDLLSNERRRNLVSFLAERADEPVPIEDVVDAVTELEWPDPGPATHRDRVAIDLHHVHLPKLADTGVIELDPVAGTVRYEGSEAISRLLELTSEISQADER